jgi:Cu/Zn superoxide dismutase
MAIAADAGNQISTQLNSMPAGSITVSRSNHQLKLQLGLFGLTPGSMHRVALRQGGCRATMNDSGKGAGSSLGVVQANNGGALNASVRSRVRSMSGAMSVDVLQGDPSMMGMGSGLASRSVACATISRMSGRMTVPVRSMAQSGSPMGAATLSYDPTMHTLTVQVTASGLTPGSHAAHIHSGTCKAQGGVVYMLPVDVRADANGDVNKQTEVIKNVMSPPPASGWYLNVHQGTSKTILAGNTPTIHFQPVLCGDVDGTSMTGNGVGHGQIMTSGGEQFYTAQALAPNQMATQHTLFKAGPFTFTADCEKTGPGGAFNQVNFNVTSSEAGSDLDGQGAAPAGTMVNIHMDSDLSPNPQPSTPALPNGTLSQTPSASSSTEIAPDGTEVELFYEDGVNYAGHDCFAGAVAFVS